MGGYDYQTSLPAYKDTPKESRDYCRQQVFIAIRKLQPCNDKQIADYLKWPINRVTPRRGELVENGLIISAGKCKDGISGRTVDNWKIKPVNFQPELF